MKIDKQYLDLIFAIHVPIALFGVATVASYGSDKFRWQDAQKRRGQEWDFKFNRDAVSGGVIVSSLGILLSVLGNFSIAPPAKYFAFPWSHVEVPLNVQTIAGVSVGLAFLLLLIPCISAFAGVSISRAHDKEELISAFRERKSWILFRVLFRYLPLRLPAAVFSLLTTSEIVARVLT